MCGVNVLRIFRAGVGERGNYVARHIPAERRRFVEFILKPFVQRLQVTREEIHFSANQGNQILSFAREHQ